MREIHELPRAGADLPMSDSIRYAIPSMASYGDSSTNYAAIACDEKGAILCAKRPLLLSPCVSLGKINWPEKGFEVQIHENGTISKSESSQAFTRILSSYRASDSPAENKAIFVQKYLTNSQYIPRILRTVSLTQAQTDALPEKTPRAATMPYLDGWKGRGEYFSCKKFSDVYYNLTAERYERTGLLLSFPLFGIKKVRLKIKIEIDLKGSTMFKTGRIEVPFRACLVPIAGTERLFYWPYILQLNTREQSTSGSGVAPVSTHAMTKTLTKLGTSTYSAQDWDINIPPSGLAIIWVDLDPAKYQDFAKAMLREESDVNAWASMDFRAKIANAIALPE